jgi:hypothetical protein
MRRTLLVAVGILACGLYRRTATAQVLPPADLGCECDCAVVDDGADEDDDDWEFGAPDLDAPPFAPGSS